MNHQGEEMARPTIKVGSKGDAVREAQQALSDRGYYVGTQGVDGIFGAHTFSGVVAYQNDRSAGSFWAFSAALGVDGVVGPQTWSRLAPDTVKKGAHGPAVRLLQEILKVYGQPEYDPGTVDGVFGPKTEAAVTHYQKDVGIAPDGVVGKMTWIALWS
jgi:peptidoglycan hydrolase-like protein with peptidoglycan-binding domain